MCLQYKSFENTVGKRENARNEHFLLFSQSFLPIWRTFCHFHRMLKIRLQTLSVWKCSKFIVYERVKSIKQQIFRLVQIESICRQQNRYNLITEMLFEMCRKYCEKRRKCWLPAFSPFPTMFSKSFFFRVIKSGIVW